MRPNKQLEDMMHKAGDIAMDGDTQVPGMTYEQGVENALRWALEETDDEPIED